MTWKEKTAGNTGFASGGLTCKNWSFVFQLSISNKLKLCASKSARTQSPKTLAVIRRPTKFHLAMTSPKPFRISEADIRQLVDDLGACIASDKITAEGEQVGYMYREEANGSDYGWRFFSGTETQEYADDPKNWAVYDTNTIANYDPAIIPYLTLPVGSELERIEGTGEFRMIEE